MAEFDYYKYLGVEFNATQDQIKKAYRKMLFKCHPDHGGSNEDMRKLLLAYDNLSNPDKRKSYDDSRSYYESRKKSQKQRENTRYENKREKEPDDYSKAIFVTGIEAEDSSGVWAYHKLGDYIYYPLTVNKQFLFWKYKSKEYYRATIDRVFSQKRNSFNHIPLFVVNVENFEQVVFLDDYKRYWLSEIGYNDFEKKSALKTLAAWSIAILLIIIFLFNPSVMQFNDDSNASTTDTEASNSSTEDTCDIKGNISISSNEKIYHLPQDKYYDDTKINSEYGERWFCNVEDAEDAGWRRTRE